MMRMRNFFGQKKVIWTLVVLVVLFGGWFLLFGRGKTNTSIQTAVVKSQPLQKTVLTTGTVVSAVDLDLSFQATGVVTTLNVAEGDHVGSGQVLATLDQSNASASLQSAQGSLAQAQANYRKILAAATPQDIAVSQAAGETASTTLQNAEQNLLNELSTAETSVSTLVLSSTNNLFSNPQSSSPQFGLPGTVQSNQQLVGNINNERVAINSALDKWQAEISTLSQSNVDQVTTDSLSNLSEVSNYLADIVNVLTTYSQSSSSAGQTALSTDSAAVAQAKTTVDSLYSAVTGYGQSVKNAQSALAQAEAALSLKQAPATPEDLAIAQAQVHLANAEMQQRALAQGVQGFAAPNPYGAQPAAAGWGALPPAANDPAMQPISGISLERYAELGAAIADLNNDPRAIAEAVAREGVNPADFEGAKAGWTARMQDMSLMGRVATAYSRAIWRATVSSISAWLIAISIRPKSARSG